MVSNNVKLNLTVDLNELNKSIDEALNELKNSGIKINSGFWGLVRIPPITCTMIALLMLIFAGLAAMWYGIGAGLLISVWPNYYFGMMAKELESRRAEEARQSRIINQAMVNSSRKSTELVDDFKDESNNPATSIRGARE